MTAQPPDWNQSKPYYLMPLLAQDVAKLEARDPAPLLDSREYGVVARGLVKLNPVSLMELGEVPQLKLWLMSERNYVVDGTSAKNHAPIRPSPDTEI